VVDLEVVDPRPGDGAGVPLEVDDARARHLEAAHLPLDRQDHPRRIELDRSGGGIAVEEVVPVLVGRHPLHDLVADRVVEQLAGVVVGDPRGQLLEADVDEPVVR
jgi:hypothetical protein